MLYSAPGYFCFDNRRLFALKVAALKLFPRVCAVEFQVLDAAPREEQQKVRTRSAGLSLEFGQFFGQGRANAVAVETLWCWRTVWAEWFNELSSSPELAKKAFAQAARPSP